MDCLLPLRFFTQSCSGATLISSGLGEVVLLTLALISKTIVVRRQQNQAESRRPESPAAQWRGPVRSGVSHAEVAQQCGVSRVSAWRWAVHCPDPKRVRYSGYVGSSWGRFPLHVVSEAWHCCVRGERLRKFMGPLDKVQLGGYKFLNKLKLTRACKTAHLQP